jgi:ureidoacrylate peracid hydrolase
VSRSAALKRVKCVEQVEVEKLMSANPESQALQAARRLSHAPVLGSLDAKIAPSHAALLVIDMQNDFCSEQGFVCLGGRDVSGVLGMAKKLPALIEAARASGVMIVFIRSLYSTADNRFLSDVWLEQAARKQGAGYTLSPVCGEDQWGGDYFGECRPQEGDTVVTKHRYNAFHGTDLDLILRSSGIRTVVVTGVSTHVCVETTARDAFIRDFYTVVVSDGTAAYSAAEHETALRMIDRFFGEITTIEQLKTRWFGSNV